jgi:predicted SnoaL-like aldol condensation-catalyzing enzyme
MAMKDTMSAGCAAIAAAGILTLAGAAWSAFAADTTYLGGGTVPKNSAEAAAIGLLDTGFNQRKYAEAFEQYVGSYYHQHNPTVPDGKQAIIEGLKQWLPTVPKLHYEFKHLYSDGDFVIVHSLVTTSPTDRSMAVVDIFRVEMGKIVEHWDVAQSMPEKALNTNTMF